MNYDITEYDPQEVNGYDTIVGDFLLDSENLQATTLPITADCGPVQSQYGPGTGIIQTTGMVQHRGGGILPDFAKPIQVVDVAGNPLEGAHVKTGRGNKVTGANGNILIEAASNEDIVTITYMGKKTFSAAFKNLGGLITLQDEAIVNDEVVISNDKKKLNPWLIGLGVLGVFVIAGAASKGKTGKTGLNGTQKKK